MRTLRNMLLLACVITCIFALSITASASEVVATGECGDNLTWELDTEGVLTISGTGPMWDYEEDYGPQWGGRYYNTVVVNYGVTTIGEYAIAYNHNLTSATLPGSLTTIGNFAFCYCQSLTTLSLPNSLTIIGNEAFAFCTNLTTLSFPDGLTTIGDGAFESCRKLTSIVFPDSLTTIGDGAFGSCPRLTSITIPASVTSLGEYAFAECDYLNSIRFLGNAPSIGFNAFRGVTAKALYPGDDTTWDDIENAYYGGNVTWIGVVAPTIITQPQSIIAFEGRTARFIVSAEGGALSYKWYVKNQGENDWSAVPGGNKATLSVTAEEAKNGSSYYCKVSNVVGSVDTNTVVLTVKPMPQAPAITGQPESITKELGTLATFSVQATGDDLEYQWYYAAPAGTSWTAASEVTAKTKAYSFTATAALDGYRFRCEVSNGAGSVTTNEAVLTVEAHETVPAISSHPKSITVAPGKTAEFTIAALGDELSYQWQVYYTGASDWLDMSGESGTSVSFSAELSQSGNRYRCKVSNAFGEVISEVATLTVKETPAAPTIAADPQNGKAAAGKTAEFTVAAKGEELTYQWYVQKKGSTAWTKVSGGTSAKLMVTAAADLDGAKYRCEVSNAGGKATSKAVTLTVVTAPKITAQPKKASVKAGKKVTFKVKASGYDLTYQWYYQKPGAKKWVKMSGKTKATLSFTAKKSKNGYKYCCYVTNAAGTTKSKAVKLTVK